MNLHELLAIARLRTPDKPALEVQDGAGQLQTWSYRELYAEVDRLAAGLQAWGLRKGDRAAVFLDNRAEFVLAYLAAAKLGAAVVPINLRYRRLEIEHILADAAPRLLISERSLEAALNEAGAASVSVEAVLWVEEWATWLGDACGLRPPLVEGDDLALLLYTSGTTGRSKGAMITHNQVLATVSGLLAAWGWEQTDRLLLVLPLFHTHGLIVGMHCALAAGATLLLRRRFEPGRTLDELQSGAATLFFGVPTIYVRLVEELRARPGVDLSEVRLFCSGSAPLAPETFDAFRALTGQPILERYGMTETGMNLSNPLVGPRIAGSVGTPLPGVSLRIVDADLADVTPGDVGQLLVSGSNIFDAYWNAPEATAASFVHDMAGRRWFLTGDLGRRDPQTGYVTLLGRSRELIIRGGFNIYPREVEELLERYPGVVEAAVVGRAHPEWGETPVAYLVCSEPIEPEALIAFCREQLAGFKVPREIYRVDALPRNAMGKVQKHLLK